MVDDQTPFSENLQRPMSIAQCIGKSRRLPRMYSRHVLGEQVCHNQDAEAVGAEDRGQDVDLCEEREGVRGICVLRAHKVSIRPR